MKNKPTILSTIFLLLFCLVVNSQTPLDSGIVAPNILFTKSLPVGYQPNTHRPVVLEFWATWCGPCIAALYESNEMVKQFSGKIDFVAITDTTSLQVEEFIAKKKFNHQFLVDQGSETFKSFGVDGIPYAYLLSADRKVVWSGYSRDLTYKVLSTYLRTGKVIINDVKPIQEKEKRLNGNRWQVDIVDRQLLKTHTTSSVPKRGAEKGGVYYNSFKREGVIIAINVTINQLFERIGEAFPEHIFVPGSVNSNSYYDFRNLPVSSIDDLKQVLLKEYGINLKSLPPNKGR